MMVFIVKGCDEHMWNVLRLSGEVKFQYTPIILEASVANRLSRNGGHVIEALDHVVAKEVEVLVRLRQPKDLVQTFEDRFLAQNLHKLVRWWWWRWCCCGRGSSYRQQWWERVGAGKKGRNHSLKRERARFSAALSQRQPQLATQC